MVGGGGDQAAGAVGNGIVEPGIISSTVGTSGVVFAFADKPVVDPKLRVHTFCHAVPGKWHVMGVMLSAGGSLRWYRDTFADTEMRGREGPGQRPLRRDERGGRQGSRRAAKGLIFLPYLTGERTPYPDPNARGVFFGITLRSDRAHFVRLGAGGRGLRPARFVRDPRRDGRADHAGAGLRRRRAQRSLAADSGRRALAAW